MLTFPGLDRLRPHSRSLCVMFTDCLRALPLHHSSTSLSSFHWETPNNVPCLTSQWQGNAGVHCCRIALLLLQSICWLPSCTAWPYCWLSYCTCPVGSQIWFINAVLYVRMQLNCSKFSQDEEMTSAAHGLETQEAITNATQVFLLFCFSPLPHCLILWRRAWTDFLLLFNFAHLTCFN